MPPSSQHWSRCLLGGVAVLLLCQGDWSAGGDEERRDVGSAPATAPADQSGVAPVRVSVAEARRQATALHAALHSTLQLVHHRYFREDEGLPIPAAVVKEIFADIESETPVRLRWLVVEGQAMNTDHLAQDEFEREAVAALKAGQPAFERVEAGLYRRAGAITLTNACLKCHVPNRKSTENRTAGLLISLPVLPE